MHSTENDCKMNCDRLSFIIELAGKALQPHFNLSLDDVSTPCTLKYNSPGEPGCATLLLFSVHLDKQAGC